MGFDVIKTWPHGHWAYYERINKITYIFSGQKKWDNFQIYHGDFSVDLLEFNHKLNIVSLILLLLYYVL